jgi:hypothetical protein
MQHQATSGTVCKKDAALKRRLEVISEKDAEFWSFRGKSTREHVHAYFQYPAMMVPQMQRELISAVLDIAPDVQHISDPFVGSGTVMTEAMLQGRDFSGQDINPLAILLCRAKSGPLYGEAFLDKVESLLYDIRGDFGSTVEAKFPGCDKWFQPEVALELSKICRGIRRDTSLWSRRLFWVALAETVRLVSNSRTSTFKLHIRPEAELNQRNLSPLDVFEAIVRRNLQALSAQKQRLSDRGYLRKGRYYADVTIQLRDSAKTFINDKYDNPCDLLVTSPPYGDNKSTVPYGQHSYLPLQWIDFSDIDKSIDRSCLDTTSELDSRSLGGSLTNALPDVAELYEVSPSIRRTVEALSMEPRDRATRVAAFCRDLNSCLNPILKTLKPNAYMIWTVGNRRVAGRLVPIDSILTELLIAKGAKHITDIQRTIPNKRMAVKNNIALTMRTEKVVVLRKGET